MDKSQLPECIEEVNRLDIWAKLKIYAHYCAVKLSLKHEPIFIDTRLPGCGRRGVKQEWNGIGLYNLWEFIEINTSADFMDESRNIEIGDMGADWEKFGYAQRYRVELHGIYEWYSKFKEEIHL
jgi:hypothetical protein